jgi:hypothetical protein
MEAGDGPEMAERGTAPGQTQTAALTKTGSRRRRDRLSAAFLLPVSGQRKRQSRSRGPLGDDAEVRLDWRLLLSLDQTGTLRGKEVLSALAVRAGGLPESSANPIVLGALIEVGEELRA